MIKRLVFSVVVTAAVIIAAWLGMTISEWDEHRRGEFADRCKKSGGKLIETRSLFVMDIDCRSFE